MILTPEILDALTPAELLEVARLAPIAWPQSRWYCDRTECDGQPHDGFGRHARTKQRPPLGDWKVWFLRAGRRGGKTRAGSEWIIDRARNGAKNIALIGRTPADIRKVMLEGESGILACSPADFQPRYMPTRTQIVWPNGCVGHTLSAEVADSVRGSGFDTAWCDELSSWADAKRGAALGTAWNNLRLAMSVAGSLPPQILVTSTPKPNALTRDISKDAGTVVVTWPSYDNMANLAPQYHEEVLQYEGTRIGRQEIMGELLEDLEGALWTLQMIDDYRVKEAPDCRRLCVGVDPTGSDRADADECGIVVVGKGSDGDAYVLEDLTLTAGPAVWARKAVAAYHDWKADKIVAEGNFGGQMVVETIHSVDKTVPVEIVNASRSKRQRAEPVAALYEQGRVHHVGAMPRLEDELTTWDTDSGWSPGRMDALVWGISWLNLAGAASLDAWLQATKERTEARQHPQEPQPPRVNPYLRRSDRCPKGPDGRHVWNGNQCMACLTTREG